MKNLALRSIRYYQRKKFFHLPFFQALFMSDAICRFKPSCSEYAYQAIKKYDIFKGCWLGLKRIIKCHPFSKGGFDPVP